MTAPTREPLVGLAERLREVTQADRDAAWPYRPWYMTDTISTVGAWNGGEHDGLLIIQAFAQHRATALEEQSREIERLRGLLIDPGDPAWEDARSVLATELRKAEMPNHARAVADGEGAYIPSWMALNLIAHAARTALSSSDTVEKGEGAC